MPIPHEYQRARADFYDYLVDLRDNSPLPTTNAAYTATQGVFQAFRRRLSLAEAIAFAQVLPAALRALFIADWDPSEPQRAFADGRTAWTAEALGLRHNHNFAGETVVADVSDALHRHVEPEAFERVLETLPDGARTFWQPGARP